MKNNYTHITLVLDRSGSMESIKTDTIGGLNQFVDTQKQVQAEITFTLIQFDDVYETVIAGKPIGEVPVFTKDNYIPRNTTALLDAIGRGIAETGDFLSSKKEEDRPSKVVFAIMTDGLENASTKFSREQVGKAIKEQKETYSWEFVFLGANQDAIATAASINIAQTHAITYAANSLGARSALKSFAVNTASYASGQSLSTGFSANDRQKQAEALKQSQTN